MPHVKQFQYIDIVEPIFTGGETITEDKWHYAWSEPVKTKIAGYAIALSVAACVLPPFTGSETTIVTKWFEPLSEPVRTRNFGVALQPVATIDTVQIATRSNMAWFAPLAEPVRIKLGLWAASQQVDSLPTPTIPVVARLIQWFAPLSEPVWLPVGLKAWLQQFLAYHPRILPTPTVTAAMAATETNADVALFGVQVYNTITPVTTGISANVSISEIQAGNSANASIEET